jgi:multidrug resistance efflux pump
MRFDRQRHAPFLVWLACLGGVVWLYQDVGGTNRVLGFAHGVEYPIAPLAPARVSNVAVDVGEAVISGQVVATLDTTVIDEEIAVERAKRIRAVARLEAAVEEAKRQTLVEERALAREFASADASFSQSRARRDEARAEIAVQQAERNRLKKLVDGGLVDQSQLATLEARIATLGARARSAKLSVESLRSQRDEARRRADLPLEERVTRMVAPMEAALEVIDARLKTLQDRRDRLVLRSPADGHIASIHLQTGGVAGPRDPVATVIGQSRGKVVACLVESSALDVSVGDPARLYKRNGVAEVMHGHVVGMGPIVDTLPSRCRPNAQLKAWGRDVVILLDEPENLLPGQVLDVEINVGNEPMSGTARAAGSATATPSSVREMVLPTSLKKRTRFEPSGLVWVPQLLRYVVVSDDTGQEGLDDNAPWLFTMDRRGQVDPSPMLIANAERVSDLESIATGKGGDLFILASQSLTKKGKRPAARRAFMRLTREVDGYRLAESVDLYGALETLTASDLKGLGLSSLDELDIEGMTEFRGGLLLGLKSPLDANGHALIWWLERPEVLLSGGTLSDAGLKLWKRISVELIADSKVVPGGIAELLSLPDGSLLIAATASQGDPERQDGTLWWVPVLEGQQSVRARRLEEFADLKPEGLAISPTPGRIVVTFDRGSATPKWAERSRPTR